MSWFISGNTYSTAKGALQASQLKQLRQDTVVGQAGTAQEALRPCTAAGAQLGWPAVFPKALDLLPHLDNRVKHHTCVPGRGTGQLSAPPSLG